MMNHPKAVDIQAYPICSCEPALLAQSDAIQLVIRKLRVQSPLPIESADVLFVEIDHEIFSTVILPLLLIQK